MNEDQAGPVADPMGELLSKLEAEDTEDDVVEDADEAGEPDDLDESDDADESDEAEEEGDDEEEEAPKGRYKVAVQDEQGKIVEQAVSFDELKAGYQRSKEVDTVRAQSHEQINRTTQEAQQYVARVQQDSQKQLGDLNALVMQALEVVSPEDLLSLSQSDPQAYMQAAARQNTLQGVLKRISAQQEQLSQHSVHADQQKKGQQLESSKRELAKLNITTDAVTKIYEKAGGAYGFSAQELAANLDHRLVLLLKDAAAYKAIQDKKPHVQNKVREAPKPPPAKLKSAQTQSQQLLTRLSKRGASRDDLQAFFNR